MNKLIERLEGEKIANPTDKVWEKDRAQSFNCGVDAAIRIVSEMCEAGEVVVPRFKGDKIGDAILLVEDGSVDTDKLEEQGYEVIVYRQGSTPPRWIKDRRDNNA